MTVSQDNKPVCGIGAVSRITGIPIDTLRVWERRYKLVTPERTPENKRVYTSCDVNRLSLIKKLVDQGHAISAVAQLSEAALLELMQIHPEIMPGVSPGHSPIQTLVYGDSLPFLLREWKDDLCFLDLQGVHRSFADFQSAVQVQKPELLILEMPVLSDENIEALRELIFRSAPKRVLVVYTFGMNSLINELDRMGVVTLRSPVTVKQLAHNCVVEVGNQSSTQMVSTKDHLMLKGVQARRFDSEMLASAATITTKLQCECPKHLADLLFRLNAFEDYSAACENRNDQDAALHRHLHLETAKARAILEDALEHLIRCENIELV